jgi:GAF domain-containing protein
MDENRAIVNLLRENEQVRAILKTVCEETDMGFAAVARVTETRWVACQVLDKIDFGLDAGDELSLKTTICDEIRDGGAAVVIDHVDADDGWRQHHAPILYGFQSYISYPITLTDGSFFGTLCAIDPEPHKLDTPEVRALFERFAGEIATLVE